MSDEREPSKNESAAQVLYDGAVEATGSDDFPGQPETVKEAIKDAKAGARFALQMFRMGNHDAGRDLLLAAIVAWRRVEEEIRLNQRREAGSRPKRRWWADEIAAEVASWEDIPESYAARTIDALEAEFDYYREGDKLYCKIKGEKSARTLTRRWFEREYLKGRGEKHR